MPFEIPSSWEWVRLGNVANIKMGQSPKGENVFKKSEIKNGVEFHQGKIYFGDKIIKESEQLTIQPTKIAEKGSILLCVRAPVGKINFTDRNICIGRGLCALDTFKIVDIKYLYNLLKIYENYFIKKACGTTFVAISYDVIKNTLIPLPPFEEQKRIVAKIEELFKIIEPLTENK